MSMVSWFLKFSQVNINVFLSLSDLKVIIMGDFNVGKTSLICRYIEGKFKPQEPVRLGSLPCSLITFHFICALPCVCVCVCVCVRVCVNYYTCMPVKSYCRWFGSLLCLCDIFQVLINSICFLILKMIKSKFIAFFWKHVVLCCIYYFL